MKKITIVLILLLLNIPLIYGYGGPPPPPPPFLKAKVTGLPYQAPLFFADTNSVTLMAQLSVFSSSSTDGKINVEGTSAASIDKNLSWIIPETSFNLGLSFKFSKISEFYIVGKIDNTNFNSDLGISILFSSDNDVRARLDLGLSSLSMDANTTFYYYNYPDTTYITLTKNDKHWDPFISLTFNTAFNDWIINPYLQLSYCFQTLFNIDYSPEQEIFSNIHVCAITPGLLYRIDKNILLVAGSSYFITDIAGQSSGIFSGFLQTNFMF